MMPFFLSKRRPELVEYMDRDNCDRKLLENTYRQFSMINTLISGWKNIYRNEIKPLLQKGTKTSLLDIGFGGGDIPIKLSKWAKTDGYELKITAIETDERALNYVQTHQKNPESVSFRNCSSSTLIEEQAKFDIVISNHLMHHLTDSELLHLMQETKQLTHRKILFSDIERSDFGFVLFSGFAESFFRNSLIAKDGRISIRRSFTKSELESIIPNDWKVKRQFPFRLQLIYESP